MDVQVFNARQELCFRTASWEPAWRTLLGYLRDDLGFDQTETVQRDFTISAELLETLLTRVEAKLRELMEGLSNLTEWTPRLLTVGILERTVTLHQGEPEHDLVKRLNDLHRCLTEAAADRSDLRVLAIPKLSSREHALARLLQQKPQGLDASQLRTELEREFHRLIGSGSFGNDLQDHYRKEIAALHDEGLIRAGIETLLVAGLARLREEGQTLMATEKLSLVRL